jgi:hypothetical protein
MPTRFRRSFKILPGVKVNVSKSGISYTVGAKGYHLNFSKRGVRQTVGLPESGSSNYSYLVKNDSTHERKESEDKSNIKAEKADAVENDSSHQAPRPRHISPFWVLLLGVIVVYLSAAMLGFLPVTFLSQFLRMLAEWGRGFGL